MRQVQDPIMPIVAELIRQHPGTISLGQGVAFYPPPAQALARLQEFPGEPGLHKYQPVAGLPAT